MLPTPDENGHLHIKADTDPASPPLNIILQTYINYPSFSLQKLILTTHGLPIDHQILARFLTHHTTFNTSIRTDSLAILTPLQPTSIVHLELNLGAPRLVDNPIHLIRVQYLDITLYHPNPDCLQFLKEVIDWSRVDRLRVHLSFYDNEEEGEDHDSEEEEGEHDNEEEGETERQGEFDDREEEEGEQRGEFDDREGEGNEEEEGEGNGEEEGDEEGDGEEELDPDDDPIGEDDMETAVSDILRDSHTEGEGDLDEDWAEPEEQQPSDEENACFIILSELFSKVPWVVLRMQSPYPVPLFSSSRTARWDVGGSLGLLADVEHAPPHLTLRNMSSDYIEILDDFPIGGVAGTLRILDWEYTPELFSALKRLLVDTVSTTLVIGPLHSLYHAKTVIRHLLLTPIANMTMICNPDMDFTLSREITRAHINFTDTMPVD